MSDEQFSFEGIAYVRPVGRGICLLNEDGGFIDPQLEDIVRDGYYRINVTLVRCPDQENFRG